MSEEGYKRLISKAMGVSENDVRRLTFRDAEMIDYWLDGVLRCRSVEILRLRFALGNKKQRLKLDEIGRAIGVSGERVRQLEAKALAKLGHPRHTIFECFIKSRIGRLERIGSTPLLERDLECFAVSDRTLKALYAAGIRTIGELIGKTQVDVLKIRNLGLKSMTELKVSLSLRGLDFKPEQR